MTAYTDAKSVIDSGNYLELADGVILDYATAGAIIAVYEGGNEVTKAKMDEMATTKAAIVCWKVISKLNAKESK